VFVETYVEQEAAVAAFMQSAVDHFGQLNILVTRSSSFFRLTSPARSA
jgi:hypothetical protein